MTLGFSTLLKDSTKDVHRIVETKAIMKQLMKGTLELDKYCHLLAGLYKIYSTLESCLEKHAGHPLISLFYFKELFRSDALLKDLSFFNYSKECNCKSVIAIVDRIQLISETDPERLVAYSYVRYLGDLSGGVFLQKRIVKVYNLVHDSNGTEFYQFPGIEDGEYFKNLYRSRLNEIPTTAQDGILKETMIAFESHGPLFDEMLNGCNRSCTFVNESLVESFRSIGIRHSHLHLAMGLVMVAVGFAIKN